MPHPLVTVARDLSRAVSDLSFADPVTHVYNPLDYAAAPGERYLERFGGAPKPVLLVGMNPGPWGMGQTGVPFGEIEAVRGWLGIDEPVGVPDDPHPERPVEGFACDRSEVSGRRLWGWAQERFGSPEAFFERFFIWNYCPLLFLEESGRNRTPDKLPVAEREVLFEPCDGALGRIVEILEPEHVVGIGVFAEKRARIALDTVKNTAKNRAARAAGDISRPLLGRILHPSPASPAANRGWAEQAEHQLAGLGIEL